MREFVTNFQKKHGQQVPMPKIYGDEDTSEEEGIELADGSKAAKKTAGGAGGSGGSKPQKKPTTGGGADTSSGGGAVHARAAAPVQVVQVGLEEENGVVTMTVMMMTPTNAGRQGAEVEGRNSRRLAKNHARRP